MLQMKLLSAIFVLGWFMALWFSACNMLHPIDHEVYIGRLNILYATRYSCDLVQYMVQNNSIRFNPVTSLSLMAAKLQFLDGERPSQDLLVRVVQSSEALASLHGDCRQAGPMEKPGPSTGYHKQYWLVVWNMTFIFPYIGNINPNWLIFPTDYCFFFFNGMKYG